MERIPYVVRVAIVPIVYIGAIVLWLTGQVVAAVLGFTLWLVVIWVRWREGDDAAEKLRVSFAESAARGAAWSERFSRRRD